MTTTTTTTITLSDLHAPPRPTSHASASTSTFHNSPSRQTSETEHDTTAITSSSSTSVPALTPTQARNQSILIVIACTAITFTGCGLNFAYGVYQEYYETQTSMPGPFTHASPAAIDLIGTLAGSLMSIGAPLASAWTKALSPRTVTLAGGAIIGLAQLLASYGTRYWHFLLTQGFLLGVGTSLSYVPAVTLAPGWFDARRGLAMGIILAGTGVGGIAWAPFLRFLLTRLGFRATLRISGGIGWIGISLAALVLKWDPVSAQRYAAESASLPLRKALLKVPLVNWRVAKSRKFAAHAAGAFCQAGVYYVPVYFFSSFAKTLGYSAATGANFIALSNATSAAGKVVLGAVADRVGRLNTLFLCTVLSAVTALGFWLPATLVTDPARAKVLFILFTATYGVFAGAYVSLFPTSLVELFGVQHFASVNGVLYMLRGVGSLVGTPVGGLLIDSAGSGSAGTSLVGMARSAAKGYDRSSIFVGVFLCAAGGFVLWARLEAVGVRKLRA